ncbi:MAG: cytochrome c3 family protein [Phycisphaerae bacterium]
MKTLLAIVCLIVAPLAAGPANPAPQDEPQAATTRPMILRHKQVPRHFDGSVHPGLTGSAHDFYGPDVPFETRCTPCHAPPTPTTQPHLWDPFARQRHRRLLERPRRQLAGGSLLCLSCHDGTIASETVGGGGGGDIRAVGAPVNPRRDHPVGVEYPRNGRKPGRNRSRTRRDFVPISKLESQGTIRLTNGRVECTSCHDPHNALGYPAFLVMSNRRSALCLSCHRK